MNWRIEIIHPIVVHFPIAIAFLCLVICAIDLASSRYRREIDLFFLFLVLFGTITAFAASFTGELAQHTFESNQQQLELINHHASIALFVFWNYLILFIVATLELAIHSRWTRPLRIVFTLSLVTIVVIAAVRGSALVYEHGIGVQLP